MSRRKFAGAKRNDEASTVADVALIELQKKLRAWLLQQPEWLFILASDRQTRKRYGLMVGDTVTRFHGGLTLVAKEDQHDDALD
jgi:hypothetical protein